MEVPFIAMETLGSNCFYQSLSLNAGPFIVPPLPPKEGTEVVHDSTYDVNFARLAKLNSRASSLGASWPSPGVVKMALERKGGVTSVCVSDEMGMQTAVRFAGMYSLLLPFNKCTKSAHRRRAQDYGRVGMRGDDGTGVFKGAV